MKTTLLALMMFAALPAFAGSFQPPEGCTTFMTVQSRGCYVANHYRCEADAPGDQWRADFDQEGIFYMSRIDSETQWVESIDLNSAAAQTGESAQVVTQTLDPNPNDPASFSDLLATGYDSFGFGLTKDSGEHSNVRGFDRLTGKSKVIDGITLQETEFEYSETDDSGTLLRRARGNEYVHKDWRLFFSGLSEWDQSDGTWAPLEGSPMQFVFPGEPGFAATQPIFDCDAVMSSFPQSLKVPDYDNL